MFALVWPLPKLEGIGLGMKPVVECLPSMCNVLGFTPSTTN